MPATFTRTFFLSAGEANAEQEMAVPVLVTNFIEIATAHANALHIGNPDMAELGGGWVLSRLTFEMQAYPLVNESYTITTWVEDFNRHFSTRCFCVSSPDGARVYGYARSVWMVMDTRSRVNLGLSHFQLPEGTLCDLPCPIGRQAKHHPIETGPDTPRYRFKYCDIDNYRHVNTVRYIQMLLNRFPLEHYDTHLLTRMELSFLREARYGMTVSIGRRDRESYTSFSLCDTDQPDSPLLFARLYFVER